MRDCGQETAEGAQKGATQRDAVPNRFVLFQIFYHPLAIFVCLPGWDGPALNKKLVTNAYDL
jgi:hypothetical protein